MDHETAPAPSRTTSLLSAAVFLFGAYLRCRYILVDSDPRTSIVGNARLYIGLAKRWDVPGHVAGPSDVYVPPGGPLFFSFLYSHDHTLTLAVYAMLAITILVPIAVWRLGAVAFGETNGKLAMAVSSVYFPFIEYGGHFLTEIPFTLLFVIVMHLFLRAIRSRTVDAVIGWSLAAGVVGSIAIAFRMVALPAMLCMAGAAALCLPPLGDGLNRAVWRLRRLAALGLLVGAIPLTLVMVVRCTSANQARVCLVCNKGPADFLLGHYGRIQGITWNGDEVVLAGSTAAGQHGYTDHPVLPFDATDGPANSAAAWAWIRANPGEAFVLSCEHVYDLFLGSFPTPAIHTPSWKAVEASQFAFVLLLLLPSALLLFDAVRTHGLRHLLCSTEFLVLSPIVGLAAAAFIATGEARYRVPFDAIFIVLGIECFRRCGLRVTSRRHGT